MASGDEDDYMSDKFLTSVAKEDVRPGLIYKRSLKRAHELEKKADQLKKVKGAKQVEAERREEGLSRPIAPDNKGFALLQKMGFREGSGLGRTGEGRKEPVTIRLKANREGLGRAEALKELSDLKRKMLNEARGQQMNTQDFRTRVSGSVAERHLRADLHTSQKACYNLDSKHGIQVPEEEWFWPSNVFPKKEDEANEDEGEQESEEEEDKEEGLSEECRLDLITFYLRKTYFYCIWCGVEFTDEQDLLNDCPGSKRSDH